MTRALVTVYQLLSLLFRADVAPLLPGEAALEDRLNPVPCRHCLHGSLILSWCPQLSGFLGPWGWQICPHQGEKQGVVALRLEECPHLSSVGMVTQEMWAPSTQVEPSGECQQHPQPHIVLVSHFLMNRRLLSLVILCTFQCPKAPCLYIFFPECALLSELRLEHTDRARPAGHSICAGQASHPCLSKICQFSVPLCPGGWGVQCVPWPESLHWKPASICPFAQSC